MQNFDKNLKNKLENLFEYELSEKESYQIKLKQLDKFLFSKITSKKFRKNNISQDTRDTILKKINLSIKNEKPLYFIFGFGGYKNHWVDKHHPYIGWAEVFHLMYVSQLFAPILKVYKPGVIYEFESEDAAVVINNNHTQDDVNKYNESLKLIIKHLSENYFPNNFKVRIVRMHEQYNTNEMFYQVGKKVDSEIEKLNKLPKEQRDKLVNRALFNVKQKGFKDYTSFNKSKLYKVGLESLAINHVFLEEDYNYRENYFNGDERIMLVGSYCTAEENPDNWITINSCARSNAAFWTSKGIAYKKQQTYIEDIVTIKQFETIKDKIQNEPSNLFKDILPNLDSIEVLST